MENSREEVKLAIAQHFVDKKIVEMMLNNLSNTQEVKIAQQLDINKWLNSEYPVINQSDFDTCGNSYSDGDYHVRHLNGYDREFRTYMNQFEN